MSVEDPKHEAESDDSKAVVANDIASADENRPKEVGGRGGLDPTRYGDWEKSGRCVDF